MRKESEEALPKRQTYLNEIRERALGRKKLLYMLVNDLQQAVMPNQHSSMMVLRKFMEKNKVRRYSYIDENYF